MAAYDKIIDYRLVSYEENWSFTPIWKNATMSIFETFSSVFSGAETLSGVHQIYSFERNSKDSNDLKMLHKDSQEYLKFVKNSFNFICLRDPYLRFISAFYHKIVLNPNGREGHNFFEQYPIKNLEEIKKLKIFLRYVEKQPKDLDAHFWTQKKLAEPERVRYDYVINFNSLNKDWETLANKFENVPRIHEKALHKSYSEDFAEKVATEKSLEQFYKRIKMLYLDDYRFLESFK